jgi:peptidoglycan/xylan/chitin deacetylase (PgdA/CDA1 family)
VKKEEMNYSNIDIHNTINTATITEKSSIIEEDLDKYQDETYDKVAYITIDDGPSKFTSQILDILDKHDVKATFFMINRNMKNYKDIVQRISEEGHGAGFHSVSHDVKELYKTPESALNEFYICRNTYKEITGKISNLVRLPYGSKPHTPEESYNKLVENNLSVWDWNLDTEDWKATTDNILSNILLHGRNKEDLVILMHEKEQTVKALQKMIDILNSKGYTILPIEENEYNKVRLLIKFKDKKKALGIIQDVIDNLKDNSRVIVTTIMDPYDD